MPEALPAEDEAIKTPEQESEEQDSKKEPSINENKLSKNEVKRLKDGQVTITQLANQRLQLKSAAEAELNQMVTATREHGNLIDLKEYKEFKEELEDTESPEDTQKILDRIKAVPAQKEKEEEKEKEEAKELDPEDPELLKLQNKFDSICNKNQNLIGTKELAGFKAWCAQERRNNPSIKHMKDLIRRLEGKEIYDRGGLAPRQKEFDKLKTIFKKHGIVDPLENEWIKAEGLSERQEFRQQIESIESHFQKVKDTPFYSVEMIAARMKENLKAKNPGELKTRLTQAKNTARKESEGFTHLDSTMTIQGITMRKMSEASKEKYLKYYKNTNFKERQELVSDWKDLVENEAELAHELEKIYKDNPEGLKLAIGSFEELDFVAKKKSLKQHEKLVEKSKGKEELEKNLTIKAAHAKIDAAARKNTIAPGSDKTQGRYKKFFENPDNFKNPKTKKPGDLGALKKAYETLVSGSPNTKYKNLSAYEQRRKEYQKNLKKLSEINPSIGKDELKKWQQRYDKEGWTKRTKIGEQDLPKEIEKQKQEHLKKLKEEKEIGITDSEKREAKERSPDRIKLELSINEYLAENTKESINEGRKALRLYLVANPDEENDTVLMYLEEQLAKAAREFGSQKVKEKSQEKMAEKEVEKALSQDEILKRQLEDEQIKHLNIHGAEISEQRHNKTISAQERAKKESIARTKAGTVEDELTRDAYEQMGDQHILNKEGTGEKIDDVMFMDGVSLQKDSRDQIKHHTYQQQSKLDTKEGFTHVKLKDKSGREISAEEAEALQEKDFEKIEDTLVDKAQDKVEKKGAKIFDLNAQIAAKRKAKELVDAKKHEKLRAA